MIVYVLISFVSGILFGIMDGLINANSLARRLYEVYKPIAKKSMNIKLGIMIDFVYGFIMAGLFLILYNSLPGELGLLKGISFAFLAWFFRGVMYAASQQMMFMIPVKTILYMLFTGLFEMLVLSLLYGLVLKPWF